MSAIEPMRLVINATLAPARMRGSNARVRNKGASEFNSNCARTSAGSASASASVTSMPAFCTSRLISAPANRDASRDHVP